MLDIAFEMASSSVRLAGRTREIGWDLAEWNVKPVAVFTDPNLAKLLPVARVLESLETHGIAYGLFDRVRVEPTDTSFQEAIAFAAEGGSMPT